MPRRGDDTTLWDMMFQIATAYQLPGTWIDVDVSTFDYFADTARFPGWAIHWGWHSTRWN